MPDLYDEEGDDDRKDHILRQNERMDDKRRFKRKYTQRKPRSEDRRRKKFKAEKPVDPRIAALDGYTLAELKAAITRNCARNRTPEEKEAIRAKTEETIRRKQAACDHMAKEPRRVKKKGPTHGKLQCPTCWAVLPDSFAWRRIVT